MIERQDELRIVRTDTSSAGRRRRQGTELSPALYPGIQPVFETLRLVR